jgi:hypothetical protein
MFHLQLPRDKSFAHTSVMRLDGASKSAVYKFSISLLGFEIPSLRNKLLCRECLL